MTGSVRSVEPTVVALDESFYLEGPPRPEDASVHRRFALDPDAARYLGWTIEQAESRPDSYFDEVIQRFVSEWQAGRVFNFSIRRREDDQAVGAVELRPTGKEANISYLIASALRGQGVATRAVEAVIAWASRALALDRVSLVCHVENIASRVAAHVSRP